MIKLNKIGCTTVNMGCVTVKCRLYDRMTVTIDCMSANVICMTAYVYIYWLRGRNNMLKDTEDWLYDRRDRFSTEKRQCSLVKAFQHV